MEAWRAASEAFAALGATIEEMHAGPDPDGKRVVTASDDGVVRVWLIAIDSGSLDDSRRLARCSPFALENEVLVSNASSSRVCADYDRATTR